MRVGAGRACMSLSRARISEVIDVYLLCSWSSRVRLSCSAAPPRAVSAPCVTSAQGRAGRLPRRTRFPMYASASNAALSMEAAERPPARPGASSEAEV